jgi:hypothetical protein
MPARARHCEPRRGSMRLARMVRREEAPQPAQMSARAAAAAVGA